MSLFDITINSLTVVALRALDPKDGMNAINMVNHEANLLLSQFFDHVSDELSDNVEEKNEILSKLRKLW